jgi:hypothetical protein
LEAADDVVECLQVNIGYRLVEAGQDDIQVCGAGCRWSDVAATAVREHRLAAGYAVIIPSSLAFGLLRGQAWAVSKGLRGG